MAGMILVYRYRVKSLNGLLNKQSRAVNYVWNFCNDTQKHALKWNKKWPTGFDLNVLTTGSSKALGIHSGTINATCEQYAKSRSQHRRPYLRYRGRKSLGWVPLKGRDLKREGDAFRFAGNTFRVFNSRLLPEGKIKDGTSFAQDARGNWFLNIVIEMPDVHARPIRSGVGIDLGLKDFATLSTARSCRTTGSAGKRPRSWQRLSKRESTSDILRSCTPRSRMLEPISSTSSHSIWCGGSITSRSATCRPRSSPEPGWRRASTTRPGRPSETSSATKRSRTEPRSRKSTKAVRPSPVRRVGRKTARRGRKVSRGCE
jgi:putative transposase